MIKVGHLGRVALLLVALTIAGSVNPAPSIGNYLLAQTASGPSEDANRLREDAKRSLDNFLRNTPTPPRCSLGFQPGPKSYVIAFSKRAEQAGLRRGDLVKSVSGMPISNAQERSRIQASLSPTEPADVLIERKGQAIKLPLPCVPEPEAWSAQKRAIEAAATGDWDTCQAAVRDVFRARGFAAAPLLYLRFRCAGVQYSSGPRNREAALRTVKTLYEWEQARIRESSYEPDGLDQIRSSVLNNVTLLRQQGFPEFANDIENQLRTAPQRVEQEEQAFAAAQPQPKTSQGTGFLVHPDGSILTALHVVDGSKSIAVKCEGRAPVPATLGDTARSVDLAILRTSLSGAPYLSIRDARSVRLGDSVFTIGFPAAVLLGAEPKFADGSISAMSGPGKEAVLMQMTVPVQPGNSGGPVVASDGSVVGVVTATEAIVTFLQVTGTLPQNINWAVKAEYAKPMFDQPAPRPLAKSRSEAIQRAMQASCLILAEQ